MMFGALDGSGEKADQAFKILEELELNQPKAVQEVRKTEQFDLRSPLTIAAGNASDPSPTVQATSARVGRHELHCVLSSAPRVGDVYRLQFDAEEVGTDVVYALCRRVRMVNESAFESTFGFFAELDVRALGRG